jgi:hypothetical protein
MPSFTFLYITTNRLLRSGCRYVAGVYFTAFACRLVSPLNIRIELSFFF